MAYKLISKTQLDKTFYAIVDLTNVTYYNDENHKNNKLSKFLIGDNVIKSYFWNPASTFDVTFRPEKQISYFKEAGYDFEDKIGFYRYLYNGEYKIIASIEDPLLIEHIDKLYLSNDMDAFNYIKEIILV